MHKRKRWHTKNTDLHHSVMEREAAFWKPQYTADPNNLAKIKTYRADGSGQFRDEQGNLMEGTLREEARKAP